MGRQMTHVPLMKTIRINSWPTESYGQPGASILESQ